MQAYGCIGFAFAMGLMVADAEFNLMMFSDASCSTGYQMSIDYRYMSHTTNTVCFEINAVKNDMTIPDHGVYGRPLSHTIEKWEVACDTSNGNVHIHTFGNCTATDCSDCDTTAYGKYDLASATKFNEFVNTGDCRSVTQEVYGFPGFEHAIVTQHYNATIDTSITWPSAGLTCSSSSSTTTTIGNTSSTGTAGLTAGVDPTSVPPFMGMIGLVAIFYFH